MDAYEAERAADTPDLEADPQETCEWGEVLAAVVEQRGTAHALSVQRLRDEAQQPGIDLHDA